MPQHTFHPRLFKRSVGFAAFAAVCVTTLCGAGSRDAMIINAELEREFVRIVTMTDEQIHTDLGDGRTRSMPIDRCMGILFDEPADDAEHGVGQLHLADGQRYVGAVVADADLTDDVVAWSHPSLGRLDFQLDEVRAVTMPANDAASSADGFRAEPDLADVIVLRNGDELHGFVLAINDPIVIEQLGNGDDSGRIVELPIDRVASIAMITPTRPASGRRVWLNDGTIMAVHAITMSEQGEFEVTSRRHDSGTQTFHLSRGSVAAMLMHAERITPLSSITPTRVDGPPTRYLLSDPAVLDDAPLLGTSRIEYRGPVTVHYGLPPGTVRFAAEAELPPESRMYGDFELVIRIDGREVERRSINAAHPTATINAEITGSELTIELREGDSGPVQNHLILRRAVLLLDG